MKAVVLQESTMIAGVMRAKGEVVWVEDSFVVGIPPIFLTADQVMQSVFSQLIDNFTADLASGKITVANLGKGLFLITEWTTDAEGDSVAERSLTVKLKTVRAAKVAATADKQATSDKYAAQVAQLTALITACGG